VQGQKNVAPARGSVSENYISVLPDGYMPHPGFIQAPQRSYQSYDGSTVESRSHPDNGESHVVLPGIRADESEVRYEDSLMDKDFFVEQMELLELFEREHLDAETAFVDAAAVAQEIFIAQQEVLHSEPGIAALEEVLADHDMGEISSLADPMSESLEDGMMAEELAEDMEAGPAYDDCLMTQEVFEQQMCEAAEQMEPREPQADMLECEDEMMPEEMDEMMDPFMIPGFYGPMPMGPGLDPGPGGPP
jgi:hypothetical protein